MFIELVKLSNHLFLCPLLLLLPSTFPSIRVFSNVLQSRWPKIWSFSTSPSNEYSDKRYLPGTINTICLNLAIFWRRKWPPTPVFLPGESHGQRSLEGWSPQRCRESDTTERLTLYCVSTVSRQRIRHCARRYPQSGNRIWSDVGPLGDLCETKEHTQVWNYSFLQIYGGKSIYKEIYSMFLMSGKKTGEVIS